MLSAFADCFGLTYEKGSFHLEVVEGFGSSVPLLTTFL